MTVAYGFLFGVYPSLVAETFGVNGLSQNWGCMIFAPVIAGNIFNLLYGTFPSPTCSTPHFLPFPTPTPPAPSHPAHKTKPLTRREKGTIYDQHSTILPDGERDCPDGLRCYSSAYWVTFVASVAGMAVTLWAIRHEHVVKARARKGERERVGARDA